MLPFENTISQSTAVRGLQVTTHPRAQLDTIEFTDAEIDGSSREVYLINGQQPGPLIDVEEGDDLEVSVKNDLAVENTIHWHGEYYLTGCSSGEK
jgi:FtsP/CotA-like multicopper oxidase with cupredoxin domain